MGTIETLYCIVSHVERKVHLGENNKAKTRQKHTEYQLI